MSNREQERKENKENKGDSEEARKKDFNTLVAFYLEGNPLLLSNGAKKEFEIRFGTNTKARHSISKIDFDNVIKQIITAGFKSGNEKGTHMLRIIPKFIDKNTGFIKDSNVRAEVYGLDLIEEYCRHNDLNKVIQNPANVLKDKISFTQKISPKLKNDSYVKPVDFYDMNFRVDFKLERSYTTSSQLGNEILKEWSNSEKKFRYIKRFQFTHPDYPIFIDLSILKTSKRRGNDYVSTNTIQEAGVFNNPENYEIEIELDNRKIGPGTLFNTTEKLMAVIRKSIRLILSGLQNTSYPISFTERDVVLQSYMRLLYGEKYQPRTIKHNDFIGPQSNTLQMENIIEPDTDSNLPNIRNNYTVTEKADGDRRMLFIDEEGKIYLFDMTMNVIFTGSKTPEKTLFNTLIDGEHIKMDKYGNSINLFAGFDIYYVSGKSVREKGFVPEKEDDLPQNYRLPLLNEVVQRLKVKSILPENNSYWKEVKNKEGKVISWVDIKTNAVSSQKPIINTSCRLRVQCKKFYATSENTTIFQACSTILSDINDNAYEYETDGLIFTPSNTGVSSSQIGTAGKLNKTVWDMSFKWKPVSHNTIDFLVTVVKDKTGKDEVHYQYQEGINTQGTQNIMPYKTLRLMCGFDEEKHGYLNPFNDMIHGKLPSPDDIDNEGSYRPEPFYPTNPYDPDACLCNILLHDSGSGLYMTTEESHKKIGIDEYGMISSDIDKKEDDDSFYRLEDKKYGDIFEEFMIVEFRYDKTAEPGWRWKPIRVRYDKTNELLRGMKNYGNAFHVANNNWRSIHHEITPHMLETGENIPIYSIDGDTYYNKTNGEKFTEAMRNFHNLFVKQKLIKGVSNRNDILIDYAVGKGGDLSKWIHSHLGFVFGIDLSRDNIHNPKNGACARYLTACKQYKKLPYALFVNGNSGLNIRDTTAFPGDKESKDKMIARAIFGQGPKDAMILGKGVYARYGEAEQGFHVSSCQFALHYFFENPKVLHGFLRNLAECTRMQGYFIGTCYDGKTIFNLLSKKKEDESVVFMQNKKKSQKICEIKKMYSETGFVNDETSIGYAISVYQDSINNYIREYLVNFDYFIELMENYGFTLITKPEAATLSLPDGTGFFSELFTEMENEIKQSGGKNRAYYGKAAYMSEAEKSISFMNRYFVFRKVRTVNALKVGKLLMKNYDFNYDDTEEEIKSQIELIDKEEKPVKKRIRKLKNKKVVLDSIEKHDENITFEINEPQEKAEEQPKIEEPIKKKRVKKAKDENTTIEKKKRGPKQKQVKEEPKEEK